jgi:hypothetical protein
MRERGSVGRPWVRDHEVRICPSGRYRNYPSRSPSFEIYIGQWIRSLLKGIDRNCVIGTNRTSATKNLILSSTSP